MVQTVLSWPEDSATGGVVTVTLVIIAAVVSTRLARSAVRRIIRSMAARSLRRAKSGGAPIDGWWQVRSARVDEHGELVGEQRRRQRIDAAARMVGHLVSVVIWIGALIAIFHLLAINPAFFLSSAGFIGAGLAIGGQHKVNDYLTGLSVHFEDRYGVGDRVVVDLGLTEPIDGVVDHVGLFSTRLRDERSTVHVPNHDLVVVRNLSQEASSATLRVRVPDDVADAEQLLRGLAGTEGLTDVVFVGDLAVRDVSTDEVEVDFSTARPLSERSLDRLARRFEGRES